MLGYIGGSDVFIFCWRVSFDRAFVFSFIIIASYIALAELTNWRWFKLGTRMYIEHPLGLKVRELMTPFTGDG